MKQTFKTQAQKEFAKTFDGLCARTSSWRVWSDFINLSAIAISNRLDMQEEREKQYHQIINQYDADEQAIFPALFDKLVCALDENPEQDFLGDMFMRLELGSHWHGQFFTPYNICTMMSKFSSKSMTDQINENGWCKINDCACGAGATLIAARNEMRRLGIDWTNKALFVGQDIDQTAALMCYVQLSLLGCAGYVVIADSLRHPVCGGRIVPYSTEEQDVWFMPALYASDVWRCRILWENITRCQRNG